MARINLLPWREVQRKEKQREFATLTVLVAVLMLAVLWFIHIHMATRIDGQNARNDFLTQQIALVDKEIAEIQNLEADKRKLLARMEVIQKLQVSRPDIVRLFEELVRRVPEGIYLTNLARTDDKLIIEGMAQSNARVATLIRNLETSPWFKNQNLVIIESDKAQGASAQAPQTTQTPKAEAYQFTLEMLQVLTETTNPNDSTTSSGVKGAKQP